MICCLGVKVKAPSWILGDNWSVIINSTVFSPLLKKNYVVISYYMVREATAACIMWSPTADQGHSWMCDLDPELGLSILDRLTVLDLQIKMSDKRSSFVHAVKASSD
eukprot:6987663-Ditylum_brightwellii.AAC.2